MIFLMHFPHLFFIQTTWLRPTRLILVAAGERMTRNENSSRLIFIYVWHSYKYTNTFNIYKEKH